MSHCHIRHMFGDIPDVILIPQIFDITDATSNLSHAQIMHALFSYVYPEHHSNNFHISKFSTHVVR